MITKTPLPLREEIEYPDSDGRPMADNTLQFEWITTIKGGLDAVFRDREDVFVAGDLLWYPVQGSNTIRAAPDAMVAFGRPKGYRGSYQQWREGNVAPQVVWEVASPGNRPGEWVRKFQFYQRYGVEEYYLYDPDWKTLEGWRREGGDLQPIPEMQGWVSPRLGVRFEMEADGLHLYGPGNRPFLTYLELERERARADREHERAEQERQRAERLAAQLRALGVEPEE
jgi:Uma2 family endonuclease